MKHGSPYSLVEVVGVVCLLCMFFLSGVNKVLHFESSVSSLGSKLPFLPFPSVGIGAAIAVELVAPFLIVYGLFDSRLASSVSQAAVLSLLVFTAVATFVYHPLRLSDKYMRNVAFFSNLSVFGGLLLLLSKVRAT